MALRACDLPTSSSKNQLIYSGTEIPLLDVGSVYWLAGILHSLKNSAESLIATCVDAPP